MRAGGAARVDGMRIVAGWLKTSWPGCRGSPVLLHHLGVREWRWREEGGRWWWGWELEVRGGIDWWWGLMGRW
jgi:hypothetical protein